MSEPIQTPENQRTLASLAVFVLMPALFWMVTGHIWEDFLITFRQSASFLEGKGLTYNEGVLLHSFTSPLNVLVPIFTAWLAGTTEYAVPLLLYSTISIACLAAGGLLMVRLLASREEAAEPLWAALLFPFFLVFSVRVTAFAVNGQEAGFWVLFLAIAFTALVKGHPRHWILAGIGWGGLMWTRPDSPLHIALLGLAALVVPLGRRLDEWIGLIKAGLLCTVLYLPWFGWAWWYYGTPVPHTVVAKSGAYTGLQLQAMDLAGQFLIVMDQLGSPFLPIYSRVGQWPILLQAAMAACSLLIVLSAFRLQDRLLRLAGICFAGSLGYLVWMDFTAMAFPWYYVPPAFFGSAALARFFHLRLARGQGTGAKRLTAVMLVVVAAAFAVSFAGSLRQIEFQQRVSEQGVRKQVGLFLKEAMESGERVYLEPIGYIGYYSEARILDFPGLVAPETVEARRETGAGFLQLPAILKPEWVVLRPSETRAILQIPGFTDVYQLFWSIDRRDEVMQARFLPGRNYPLTDAAFLVFKRKSPPEDRDPPDSPAD
jgi:hypothetical protein